MISRLEVDERDIRYVRNVYYQQRAAVRVEDELTELVDIKQGVRQEGVLSPDLFMLYREVIVREFEMMDGFIVGG